LSTPLLLVVGACPNRLIEMGTSLRAPLACLTDTATFTVMVSLSRFATESLLLPKNSTSRLTPAT
jgi:hypothetical protein